MRSKSSLGFAILIVAFSPALALAHPGHIGHSFRAGVPHPLSGNDHIAAMLAVGIWAAYLGGRARWLLPVAFVGTMIAGGILAMNRVTLPMVEREILASVLVVGLILLMALRLPAGVGAAVAALFAMFHGYAHGAEMPVSSAGGNCLAFCPLRV